MWAAPSVWTELQKFVNLLDTKLQIFQGVRWGKCLFIVFSSSLRTDVLNALLASFP